MLCFSLAYFDDSFALQTLDVSCKDEQQYQLVHGALKVMLHPASTTSVMLTRT